MENTEFDLEASEVTYRDLAHHCATVGLQALAKGESEEFGVTVRPLENVDGYAVTFSRTWRNITAPGAEEPAPATRKVLHEIRDTHRYSGPLEERHFDIAANWGRVVAKHLEETSTESVIESITPVK